MSSLEHTQALDQLQKEVNRTLQNLGHLFKAANNGSKSATTARANQLKTQLPNSINSFHDALDSLGDEIQLAKLLMRRDLAILRERPGQEAPSLPASRTVPIATAQLATVSEGESKVPEVEIRPVEIDTSTDVEMHDIEAEVPETQPEVSVSTRTEEAQGELEGSEAPAPTNGDPTHRIPDDMSPPSDENAELKNNLKVDTSPAQTNHPTQPPREPADIDDTQPDTAAPSEGQDLESLFNDPISASGSGNTTTTPATGPGTSGDPIDPTDFTAGFDFSTFNPGLDHNNAAMDADNSITALLPGLQDYANTQPIGTIEAEEPDFNALFASDVPMDGEADGQQAGAQRDTTFDDLMNFAEFEGDGYEGGAGEGGGGNESDFDFTNLD
ncbi:hypothetical protein LTR91_002231 [Friedmanniomyces endolithicus]|uniref:Uncharacterized protein n=2 Tax=Friedmanniomyces endolithicus TaxID=329885 RepID=A0AAN6FI54_9PEZI|nr:hypothetical protein LTS09_016004 [Friedmanniomyces endolithicus]KAK0267908.1 hypothetical protein LTR35_015966 [Friedmanniomyces endolithicus]KAK0269065.1 hypothetical protein LTS00_017399 [Friedmanniomyces endolithicus]KAK0301866.1 hypothetical protein LTR01_009106 [Friedmanniomyces endolithicus]KAK0318223.1 hypothetical protein LTR82_010922 [Friedmanniomyces endolithicus]